MDENLAKSTGAKPHCPRCYQAISRWRFNNVVMCSHCGQQFSYKQESINTEYGGLLAGNQFTLIVVFVGVFFGADPIKNMFSEELLNNVGFNIFLGITFIGFYFSLKLLLLFFWYIFKNFNKPKKSFYSFCKELYRPAMHYVCAAVSDEEFENSKADGKKVVLGVLLTLLGLFLIYQLMMLGLKYSPIGHKL